MQEKNDKMQILIKQGMITVTGWVALLLADNAVDLRLRAGLQVLALYFFIRASFLAYKLFKLNRER